VFECSIRDFFEPQNVILMVASLGCMLRFGLLLLSAQFVIFFLRLKRSWGERVS